MKSRFRYILLIVPLVLLSLTRVEENTLVIRDFSEKALRNVVKKKLPEGSWGFSLEDLGYHKTSDVFSTDIYLSFDKEPLKYGKDDSGKYNIYSSDYNFVSDAKAIGKGCASFFKRDHGVYINSSEGLFLGSNDALGSFNIEFRFKALQTNRGILFSRVGYLNGAKKGIEISLENGKIIARMHNMFISPDSKSHSLILSRGGFVSRQQWHHFSLSFDQLTGKVSKILDGEEEDVIFMTSDNSSQGVPFTAFFGKFDSYDMTFKGRDLPLAVIGKDYIGLIDEFRISYMDFHSLSENKDIALKKYKGSSYAGRIPYNREGVITGEVISFPTTGTEVTDISWDDELPFGTFIWMEARTSDRLFDRDERNLKWYKVSKNQKGFYRVRDDKGDTLSGKFFQIRAHLVADSEGENSPLLKKIIIKYRPDIAPDKPMLLQVESSGDRYVVLKWKKNVEHDLKGYKIYYGTKKGLYDGIIYIVNGSRIDNSLSKDNFIRIKIDNTLIEENRRLDNRNVLIYPLLENTVLYYFAVTAYDSYKVDTPHNHESELSDYVSARPFFSPDIK